MFCVKIDTFAFEFGGYYYYIRSITISANLIADLYLYIYLYVACHGQAYFRSHKHARTRL